ncbi:MAG: NAD(P)/FAD-dependent oxidoreductase [Gammaproteobacteria bacterium]|nr:NAD(P)/FAD-dependent oxidoreductase [Gammaproteobacteria bacterium]
MDKQYDVVVIGAGHNALITACYLARAGLSVLALERNPWLGGGVTTREIVAPGFRHDVHASAHVYIQANPLLLQDELGLLARYGLKYIYPDAIFSTIFDDHSAIVTYADLDRTCESIAAISPRDADAYRRFVALSKRLLPMLTAALYVPPVPQGPFWALLDQSAEGRDLMHAMQKSVLDLVRSWFDHEKVIVHLLKFTSEALVGPEEKGTGITLYTMPGFVHTYPSGMPEGGSGALVDALVRCLEDHGGEVRANTEVDKVLVENGRAVGVRTAGGETFRVRTAVVGSLHPWLLDRYVDGLDPAVAANARAVQVSSYAPAAVHFALHATPEYRAGEEAGRAFLTGMAPSRLEPFRRVFDSFRYGQLPRHAMMTALVNSRHDPGRAPPGKATLCLWGFMPFALADGGAEAWDARKEELGDWLLGHYRHFVTNVDDACIIGRRCDTPLDVQRSSPSFQRGDVHGIGPYLYQFGGHRPTPELAQYAVPGVEGLYLSGCCMHPGGGVFGGGRATAIRMLDDLGMDFEKVIA